MALNKCQQKTELAKVENAEISLAKASGPVRLSSVFGGGKK